MLIIGLPTDPTIQHCLLSAKLNRLDYVFFDLSKFLLHGRFSWDSSKRCGFLDNTEKRIVIPNEGVGGIFCRLIFPRGNNDGRNRKLLDYRYRALSEILQNVDLRVINRPYHDLSNSSKIFHLALLKDCGFRIPHSIVTNNKWAALNFFEIQKRVIYKGVSSAKTWTSLLSREDVAALNLLKHCPVLFQEMIEGVDVRTHLIGERFFSLSITSGSIDYRYNAKIGDVREVDIPSNIKENCLEYQRHSGLDFIGFDFKVSNENEYYVLEANPMPGFEGYDVSFEISKALFEMFSN